MSRATQVEALWNGLRDANGEILNAGLVYTYYAGTSTPVSLYDAQDKSGTLANPIVLDSSGQAQAWGDGAYKFVVKDSGGTTLQTLDGLLYGSPDDTTVWAGNTSGSSNAYTATTSPAQTSLYHGLTVTCIANFTTSAASTMNLDSLGAVAIKQADGTDTTTGTITSGNVFSLTYDTTGTAVWILNTNTSYTNLTVTGTLTVASITNSSAMTSPSVTYGAAAMTLGTSAVYDVYMQTGGSTQWSWDGTTGDYVPATNKTHDVGDSTHVVAEGYINTILSYSGDALSLKAVGAAPIDLYTNGTHSWRITSGGDMEPQTNNTYDVGTSTKGVAEVHVHTINFMGTTAGTAGSLFTYALVEVAGVQKKIAIYDVS